MTDLKGKRILITGEWMFDPKESANAIAFMLTQDKSVNIKRLDIIKE